LTAKFAGVEPVMGETDNQGAPVPTAAPKSTSIGLFVLFRAMLWDIVEVPPIAVLNVRLAGDMTNAGLTIVRLQLDEPFT